MNKEVTGGMKNSISMVGGEGPNSYSRNSKFQKQAADQARIFISESIEGKLELQKDLKVFSIADLGCSVGPNTFSSVDTIIQAVQHKYRTQSPELKLPEFHVHFNDHVSNDFNTLFRTLPQDRQYFAAGVPGSFQGRLFPKSTMNLMHSAFALHWLTQVPEEVMKEDSPLWNKGRITYVLSSSQIADAFRAQFFCEIEAFLRARSAELAPGGLLVILMPYRADGTQVSESTCMHDLECLGHALADMAKEGLISQELINSFNIPIFIPTPSEVKEAICSSNSQLTIEKDLTVRYPITVHSPDVIQLWNVVVRAALGVILSKHFGQEHMDELFRRYPEKLEELLKTRLSTHPDKLDRTLLLVLRKDAS